jgi:hypothetical protein
MSHADKTLTRADFIGLLWRPVGYKPTRREPAPGARCPFPATWRTVGAVRTGSGLDPWRSQITDGDGLRGLVGRLRNPPPFPFPPRYIFLPPRFLFMDRMAAKNPARVFTLGNGEMDGAVRSFRPEEPLRHRHHAICPFAAPRRHDPKNPASVRAVELLPPCLPGSARKPGGRGSVPSVLRRPQDRRGTVSGRQNGSPASSVTAPAKKSHSDRSSIEKTTF